MLYKVNVKGCTAGYNMSFLEAQRMANSINNNGLNEWEYGDIVIEEDKTIEEHNEYQETIK